MLIVVAKKAELLGRTERLNRDSYTEKIKLLSCYEGLKSLLEKDYHSSRRLICTNEKEYLGSAYTFIIRLLLMLREDKQLFAYLLQTLETMVALPHNFLDKFADELVFLFFADFSSTEKNVISILRQFELQIQVRKGILTLFADIV